ncbi:MAG: type II toxin-antitoxin system VapC family toxin [Microbacteriaceae bacterium]|nr:type II toxin-antitoxin system VapC family toxin [Microbacteriaceae bacterium]
MIVCDTNVLSEPLRTQPNPEVLVWLGSVVDDIALTSVTVGEILTGVRSLPAGQRRDGLMAAVEQTFTIFADRVLPYNEPAAREYASLQETRRTVGRPLSVEDGMIAAICRTEGFSLATRNTKDFAGLGLDLINPWDDSTV